MNTVSSAVMDGKNPYQPPTDSDDDDQPQPASRRWLLQIGKVIAAFALINLALRILLELFSWAASQTIR